MNENSPNVPEHGGHLNWAARRYGRAAADFVDFSANINPLGTPKAVMDTLHTALTDIRQYPDPDGAAFRQAVAERWNIAEQAVRPLNGAAEGFILLLQLWRPDRVVIPGPAFAGYARAARAVGAEAVHVPFQVEPNSGQYTVDTGAIVGELHPGAGDVVILTNPNNPTGHTVPRDVLTELVQQATRKGAYVLIDEAFLDFIYDERELSFCKQAATVGGVAVVRSLTKMYALPGLRLGFVVTEPDLLAEMDRIRQPWPVNNLALAAGVAALTEGDGHVAQTRDVVAAERTWLVNALSRLRGIDVTPGAVNFLLLALRPPWPEAAELADRLGERGILVRVASNFPGLGPSHLRIAVRGRHDNERLIAALADVGAAIGAAEAVK